MEKIPYILELEIPFVPRRLNEVLRQFRFKRNDEFKEVYRLIHLLTAGKRPNYPLDKCHITIIRKVDRARFLDFDSLTASYKPVVDGLVHAEIIIDDNYGVTGPWTVLQEFRPRKDGPLTYLRIEGFQEATPRPYEKILKKKKGKKDGEVIGAKDKRAHGHNRKDGRGRSLKSVLDPHNSKGKRLPIKKSSTGLSPHK